MAWTTSCGLVRISERGLQQRHDLDGGRSRQLLAGHQDPAAKAHAHARPRQHHMAPAHHEATVGILWGSTVLSTCMGSLPEGARSLAKHRSKARPAQLLGRQGETCHIRAELSDPPQKNLAGFGTMPAQINPTLARVWFTTGRIRQGHNPSRHNQSRHKLAPFRMGARGSDPHESKRCRRSVCVGTPRPRVPSRWRQCVSETPASSQP